MRELGMQVINASNTQPGTQKLGKNSSKNSAKDQGKIHPKDGGKIIHPKIP
mgnify:CR=1 FL=1